MVRSSQSPPVPRYDHMPRHAAVYLFVSTDESISKSDLDIQRSKTQALAKVKGWHITKEYKDTATAAGESDRPALAQMLRDTKAGTIDGVLLWSLDRLGHSMSVVVDLVLKLHSADVAIVAWKESIDTTTPAGQFALTIFATLADLDRSGGVKSRSSGPTKRNKPANDMRGSIPYGYRRVYDPDTGALKTISIAPKQAEIVRRIFSLRDQGQKLEDIAADVQTMGNSPRGAGWTPTAVHRILNNREKYEGSPRGTSGERWPVILERNNDVDDTQFI